MVLKAHPFMWLFGKVFKTFAIWTVILLSYCWIFRILFIFWVQAIYLVYDLQIFSANLWLIFFFLKVSFRDKKFLILISSNLSEFSLLGCPLDFFIRNSLPNARPTGFSPLFTSVCFIVLRLCVLSILSSFFIWLLLILDISKWSFVLIVWCTFYFLIF